ncbi:Ribonuclease/ribotoxin [Lentinus tigrinus ALCF2SS1-7]|uniref:Ribonuclease/ribotoxin n=1 Tax=Lentinus tigrinus ALCF2SS1-6 TaxID=1328759 RepID=A0A5C2S5J8_9APHY|nr:Ribonuclease/ribotoxin [Lentinus tigrinus ALCF2SS1-6]RPD69878.1 Ribonuclease/ribotoxin [Lentinus tigrinus ALCF2SS1-7]
MKFAFTSAIVSTVLVIAGLADLGSAQSPLASCRCPAAGTPARTYSRAQIGAAVTAGAQAPPRTIGNYPHTFGNFERILFATCTGQTLNEFPILTTGPFTGRGPGPDRVIYTSSGQFCGCITHTGAPTAGGFVPCLFTV